MDSVLSILDAPIFFQPRVGLSEVSDNLKNLTDPEVVFFGHVLSASSGVLMFYFFENNVLSIALGLALAIMAMQMTNTIHPPAGANPIIAILGAKTFEFVIMPVAIGALFIVIFALIYNKVWNR